MFAKIKCRCLITQGNRDNIPIHNWIFGLILYVYSSSNEKIIVAGSCFYICVCRIAWHTMYYSRISTLYIYGIDHLRNPGPCHPRWRFSTPNVTSLFLEMTNKTQMYFDISCRKFDRGRLKTTPPYVEFFYVRVLPLTARQLYMVIHVQITTMDSFTWTSRELF